MRTAAKAITQWLVNTKAIPAQMYEAFEYGIFSCLLITGGVDVRTVAARLGHSQTSTTLNIYAETIKNAEAAAAQALDDILLKKA